MSRAIAESAQDDSFRRSFTGMGQALATFWRELTRDAVSPYRPEKHYMRGPGPAWQAKHGALRTGQAAD